MSDFKERLLQVRKSMGSKMTQEAFAALLGYKRAAYNVYEQGRIKEVPEVFIKIVCAKTGVNEQWLRSGVGDMHQNNDDALLDALTVQRQWTPIQRRAMGIFLKMPSEAVEACAEAIQTIIDEWHKAEQQGAKPTDEAIQRRLAEIEEQARADIMAIKANAEASKRNLIMQGASLSTD